MESTTAGVISTLISVISVVFRSIFWWGDRFGALNASGVLLITFLVVHAAGNSLIFFGHEKFNIYGHQAASNPALIIIEWYLLIALLWHVGAAMFILVKTKKYRLIGRDVRYTAMFGSGCIMIVFIYQHLMEMRFGNSVTTQYDSLPEVPIRNLYLVQKGVLASVGRTLFYIVSVLLVGIHLLFGWKVAVTRPSMSIPQVHRPIAILLGNLLLFVIISIFIAATVCTHLDFV